MLNKITVLSTMLLWLLCGCSIIFGPSDVVRHPHNNKTSQQYSYIPPLYDKYTYGDVKSYNVGEWVLYKITSAGDETSDLKISVVAKEGNNFWIEVSGNGLQGVSRQFVTPECNIKKAFYSENNKPPVEQTIEHYVDTPSEWPKMKDKKVGRQVMEFKVGKFDTIVTKTTFIDEDGRLTEETKYTSSDIPKLYSNGLIMLNGAAGAKVKHIELISFGKDAKPTIQIPNQ